MKRKYNTIESGNENLEKKLEWRSLPKALWINIGTFLEEADYQNTFVSSYFALITLNWISNFYLKKYNCIPVLLRNPQKFDLDLLQRFSSMRKYDKTVYYPLKYYEFIELFFYVEYGNVEAARNFIAAHLPYYENIADIVFCQVNACSETIINIARRKKLQDFLDYCYTHLILNGWQAGQKNSLIKIGNYTTILSELEHKMSGQALWWYGCAFMCNQDSVCEALSGKTAWQMKYFSKTSEEESFLMIAAHLNSTELASLFINHHRSSLNNVIKDHVGYELEYDINLRMTSAHTDAFNAYDIAASKKNNALIKQFAEFTCGDSGECLFYAIERQDLELLQSSLKESSYIHGTSIYPHHNNIIYKSPLSTLGAAIAKNWVEGVQCLLQSGFSLEETKSDDGFALPHSLNVAMQFGRLEIAKYLLESKADPNGFTDQTPPIFDAIKKNKLELVQLLVESKASLEVENKSDQVHRYPLVSAALNNNQKIVDYLIQNIEPSTAVTQLVNVSSFFGNRAHSERNLLEQVYHKVGKPLSSIG
jgi:hypothetical protein